MFYSTRTWYDETWYVKLLWCCASSLQRAFSKIQAQKWLFWYKTGKSPLNFNAVSVLSPHILNLPTFWSKTYPRWTWIILKNFTKIDPVVEWIYIVNIHDTQRIIYKYIFKIFSKILKKFVFCFTFNSKKKLF